MQPAEKKPPDDTAGLGDGLKDLSRAIEGVPASISREFHLVERAFTGGCLTGAVAGIVLVFAIAKLIGWIRGEKA